METPLDPRDQLREQEQAAALPWIQYPRTPWFPLAGGLWASTMLAAMLYLWRDPWIVPVLLVLVAIEGAFFGWYRSKRGTSPSLRSAPPEFRPAFMAYVVGVAVVVAALALAVVTLPDLVAVLLCFLLVTGGLQAYEVAYGRAAAAAQARLR
jgi:hypothetical protein